MTAANAAANTLLSLEILSLIFAVATFGVATYLWYRDSQGNKRFVESQVDEKIAVLYGYALCYDVLEVKPPEKDVVTLLSENQFLVEKMETDVRAVAKIMKDAPQEQRTRLAKAMGALVTNMKLKGFVKDAERLDRVFKSFPEKK